MEQKLNMLQAAWKQLEADYEEYLDSEYAENAPSHWCSADKAYEGPDFETWTSKNCLSFYDWILEEAEEEQVEEILTVIDNLFREK